MTETERIIKLETTTGHIKNDVTEIKDMLSTHIERESKWRDVADKAYAGKWIESAFVTMIVGVIIGMVGYVTGLF